GGVGGEAGGGGGGGRRGAVPGAGGVPDADHAGVVGGGRPPIRQEIRRRDRIEVPDQRHRAVAAQRVEVVPLPAAQVLRAQFEQPPRLRQLVHAVEPSGRRHLLQVEQPLHLAERGGRLRLLAADGGKR